MLMPNFMKTKESLNCLRTALIIILAGGLVVSASSATDAPAGATQITIDAKASYLEKLARQEVRRYVYLRSGLMLPLAEAGQSLAQGEWIVIGQKDRPTIRSLVAGSSLETTIAAL